MRFQVSTLFKVLGVGVFLLIFNLALQAGPAPDGGDLFKQECSMCHGVDGKGYPALKTPDFTDPKVQASLTDKEIVGDHQEREKGHGDAGLRGQAE